MDTTIDAGSVWAEPCVCFVPDVDDSLVCECGWLEHDHGELANARAGRRRARDIASVLIERRAS